MTFTREQVHADQMARLRAWGVGQGHRPDVYRRRPPREQFMKTDPRGQR